jgi:hypothetical protein
MSVSPFQMTPAGAQAAVAPTAEPRAQPAATGKRRHAARSLGARGCAACALSRRARKRGVSACVWRQRSVARVARRSERTVAVEDEELDGVHQLVHVRLLQLVGCAGAQRGAGARGSGSAAAPHATELGARSEAAARHAACCSCARGGGRRRRTLGHRDGGRGDARGGRGGASAQRGLRRRTQLVATTGGADRRAAGAAAGAGVRSCHDTLPELHGLHIRERGRRREAAGIFSSGTARQTLQLS